MRTPAGDPLVARVFVVGTGKSASYQAISDGTGAARFVLPDGRYWVSAEASGYDTAREAVDVTAGTTRDVDVVLVRLQEIGSTHSRISSSVRVSAPGTAARKLSPDLVDALNSIAGVAAISGAGSLGLRVSLGGEDESLTQYSFGGAALPANAAALSINTDLVQSVQIDQSRELVRFIGLGPTATPVTNLRVRGGSYGTALNGVSFQDTVGAVGIAALHTLRAEESPLNGAVYGDSSGASYRHVGALHVAGDYVKVTAPVGTWAGSAVMTSSRLAATPLRTYFAGDVPSGTGPGERTDTTVRNPVFALNGAVASTSVSLTYAEFTTVSHDRQRPRLSMGAAFPFDLDQQSGVRTYSVAAERGLTANATLEAGWQRFQESSAADISSVTNRVEHGVDEVSAGVRSAERESGTWRVEYKGGRVENHRYGEVVASAHRRAGQHLSAGASASFGTIAQRGSDLRTVRGWLEPYAADVDCADRLIVTEGPGDVTATPRRVRLFGSAQWSRAALRVSGSAWYARTRDQLLSGALVPLRPQDSGVPLGYVDALVSAAASSLQCGTWRRRCRLSVFGLSSTRASGIELALEPGDLAAVSSTA